LRYNKKRGDISSKGGCDMKRIIYIALTTIALMLAASPSGYGGGIHGGGFHGGGFHGGGFHGGFHGHGHFHSSFGVFIGPGWWGYPYPYYPYYPYPYYPYPYPYYGTPPQQENYEFVQPESPSYWYFCQNPKGYYPYVKQCPNGWMRVVPTPQSKGGGGEEE
jgi:hypothetical protein